MTIDIAKAVRSEGELFSAELSGPFEEIDFVGESYKFPSDAKVNADWRYDGEGITVTGSFSADMLVRCARCLDEFLYRLDFDFAEYYKKQPQEGMYAYNGDTIDLSQMLEDNVVINLPTRFICSEECKGLCGRCGANLNEGECGCKL